MYVAVCVFTGSHVWGYACPHTHTCTQRPGDNLECHPQPGVILRNAIQFIWHRVFHWPGALLTMLGLLARECQISSRVCLPGAGITSILPCLAFLHGVWGPKSGPQACEASTFPIEPSLQSQDIYLQIRLHSRFWEHWDFFRGWALHPLNQTICLLTPPHLSK